jgi:hypothetical protein
MIARVLIEGDNGKQTVINKLLLFLLLLFLFPPSPLFFMD